MPDCQYYADCDILYLQLVNTGTDVLTYRDIGDGVLHALTLDGKIVGVTVIGLLEKFGVEEGMAGYTEGNNNIRFEITDPMTFHCFRLLLNPVGHDANCAAAMVPGADCSCGSQGEGVRLEIMFHARSLVDLIQKANVALCEWQAQTSQYLIDKLSAK